MYFNSWADPYLLRCHPMIPVSARYIVKIRYWSKDGVCQIWIIRCMNILYTSNDKQINQNNIFKSYFYVSKKN